MPSRLATVELHHRSGLSKDSALMNFVIDKASAFTSTDETNISAAFTEFFNTNVGTTSLAIATLISPSISRTVNPTVRQYDITGHLDGTPHGSPVHIGSPSNLTAAASGNAPLPAEVAIVMSMHSNYGTDVEFAPASRPRARDRGRVFVGPLNAVVITEDTTTHKAIVGQNIRDCIGGAGQRLAETLATDGMQLMVWSRKDAATKPVSVVSVDDAFDTQRRRGEDPVIRNTYIVPGV